MVQMIAADGGNERYTNDVSLDEAQEGDRIAPELIPRNQNIDVGEDVAAHLPKLRDEEDDRTFGVCLIAKNEDRWGDVQSALVYDPDADLFARISGHTNSGAMNQKERDWKVRDVGSEVVVDDAWDIEVPDLDDFGQTEQEFAEEWVEIVLDNARHGETIDHEMVEFDNKTFTLRDHDGRTAKVQYELEDE